MIQLYYVHKKTMQPAELILVTPAEYLIKFTQANRVVWFNKETFEEQFEPSKRYWKPKIV